MRELRDNRSFLFSNEEEDRMSDLRIRTCPLGMLGTNCYIVYHDRTKQAVIIDPADDSGHILTVCRELGLQPEAILLTHGHFDHIGAAEELRLSGGMKIYAGAEEDCLLRDPALNLTGMYGTPKAVIAADCLLKDQEELQLIGFTWRTLGTPGHTAGSVCYYLETEGVLLSGDTLFAESLGRSDFPTGNSAQIVRTIREQLFSLPDETMVYPGHGEPTSIGHEKEFNPVAVYGR